MKPGLKVRQKDFGTIGALVEPNGVGFGRWNVLWEDGSSTVEYQGDLEPLELLSLPSPGHRVIVKIKTPLGKHHYTVAEWIPKFFRADSDYGEEFLGELDYNEEKDELYWPEGWYESSFEAEETNWMIASGEVVGWIEIPKF